MLLPTPTATFSNFMNSARAWQHHHHKKHADATEDPPPASSAPQGDNDRCSPMTVLPKLPNADKARKKTKKVRRGEERSEEQEPSEVLSSSISRKRALSAQTDKDARTWKYDVQPRLASLSRRRLHRFNVINTSSLDSLRSSQSKSKPAFDRPTAPPNDPWDFDPSIEILSVEGGEPTA